MAKPDLSAYANVYWYPFFGSRPVLTRIGLCPMYIKEDITKQNSTIDKFAESFLMILDCLLLQTFKNHFHTLDTLEKLT